MDYEQLFDFAASKPSFSSYYNQENGRLSVFQIFSFEITNECLASLKEMIADMFKSEYEIHFYVDDKELTLKNTELLDENIGEYLEFRIRHNLADLIYSLIFNSVSEFEKFVEECIMPLNISNINEVKEKIKITIRGSEIFDAGNSILFCNEDCTDTFFKILPATFKTEETFQSKNCLAIPNLLPDFMLVNNSENLLKGFFECVAEKIITDNEFMINIGDIDSIIIHSGIELSIDQLKAIFLVTNFVFQDNKNYLEKLWILRKKLFDCVMEGYKIQDLPWGKIIYSTKNNYHLLVNRKLDDFFDKKLRVEKALNEVANDISSEINKSIEDISKELLTIIGALLASFALKINMDQQTLFIGAALLYCIFLYIIYSIRGFDYKSEMMKKRIEDLKENFEDIYKSEEKYYEDISEKRIKPILNALINTERIRKIFLLLMLSILVILLLLLVGSNSAS